MLKNFFEDTVYNTPIYETSNFVVLPSLGALVQGWLLIVPKNFYLNFSQLPLEKLNEVTEIINHLDQRFRPIFNATSSVVFEHGPADIESSAGCGVDYAHLHWVPTEFDLRNGLSRFLNLDYEWINISQLKDVKAYATTEMDYLLLRDQEGKFILTCQDKIPSQTFRKVIAQYLEQPQKFDWKANQYLENISAVYSKLNLVR